MIDSKLKIEDLCLRGFKLSLDLAIIPIKKILFIYFFYLDALFGGPPKHTVPAVRIINKEFYKNETQKKAKAKEKEKATVEDFYVLTYKLI